MTSLSLSPSVGDRAASRPLKSLADFKRRAQVGARFVRSFPGQEVQGRIVTVAYVQSNAIVFPPSHDEATPEVLARVAENPQRHGSWWYFPKADRCRFEDGQMIVLDLEDRPLIAFRPLDDGETQAGRSSP